MEEFENSHDHPDVMLATDVEAARLLAEQAIEDAVATGMDRKLAELLYSATQGKT